MMRRFGSLWASSNIPKQSLLVLERWLTPPAYLSRHHQAFGPTSILFGPTKSDGFRSPVSTNLQSTTNGLESLHDEGMSRSGIRVVSVQNVKPDKPTPANLRSYKLSSLDQIQAHIYLPFIFFYKNNTNIIDNIVFERSKLLKQSLSETLSRFYPFAGKLINDSHIDCNDEGVYYIETQVHSDLSTFLAKPDDHKLLQRLLPIPPNSTNPIRGSYITMIQVNFFTCGGVAISISNSHKLVDGNTSMMFLNAWASAAAAKNDPQKSIVYPKFVAPLLFLPNTTQASTYDPSVPILDKPIWPSILKKGKCSTKRFVFEGPKVINELKANSTVSSSRAVAIASLIWKCATMAARKLNGQERPSVLSCAVNLRSRFAPPLPQNVIGNIIWNELARCEEESNNLSLSTMVGHVNDSLAKIDTNFAEKFKGEKSYEKVIDELKRLGDQVSSYHADYYLFSSMCKSGVYEADFGWGKPMWSCYAYFFQDVPLYINGILLMDTSTGNGIEAWVTLGEEEMAIFERDPEILLYASINPSPLQQC